MLYYHLKAIAYFSMSTNNSVYSVLSLKSNTINGFNVSLCVCVFFLDFIICRNLIMPRMQTVESVEQSGEQNSVTTARSTFKPKDKFEDLQKAIRKLKTNDEKTSKQASNELETFPTLGELLNMHIK